MILRERIWSQVLLFDVESPRTAGLGKPQFRCLKSGLSCNHYKNKLILGI